MRARPPRPSVFFSTRARCIRWVKCTKAPPSPTGWNKSANVVSRSPPLLFPVLGMLLGAPGRASSSASTSSTLPDTWISRPRSSAPCACSMAPLPCSTPFLAYSPSPKPFGVRPTSTACLASRSSTRWTASARISSVASTISATSLRLTPTPCICPSALKKISRDLWIWCRM